MLSPYKSKQKEVGVKYELGGLGLGAAFFTTDRPLSYKDAVTRIESTNGKQRNRGVELTAYGELARGVRLLSGVTFLDAKQVQTSGSINNGKYAIGVSRMQANAGVDVDVPGVRGLSVNARATYTSTQYVDAANQLEVPSWVRYDLGARYLTDSVDVPSPSARPSRTWPTTTTGNRPAGLPIRAIWSRAIRVPSAPQSR